MILLDCPSSSRIPRRNETVTIVWHVYSYTIFQLRSQVSNCLRTAHYADALRPLKVAERKSHRGAKFSVGQKKRHSSSPNWRIFPTQLVYSICSFAERASNITRRFTCTRMSMCMCMPICNTYIRHMYAMPTFIELSRRVEKNSAWPERSEQNATIAAGVTGITSFTVAFF